MRPNILDYSEIQKHPCSPWCQFWWQIVWWRILWWCCGPETQASSSASGSSAPFARMIGCVEQYSTGTQQMDTMDCLVRSKTCLSNRQEIIQNPFYRMQTTTNNHNVEFCGKLLLSTRLLWLHNGLALVVGQDAHTMRHFFGGDCFFFGVVLSWAAWRFEPEQLGLMEKHKDY